MVPAIEVEGGWETVLDGPSRAALERSALPEFLHAQRWFGGKARQIGAVRVIDWGRLPDVPTAFATVLEVAYADGKPEQYFVPLTVAEIQGEATVARLTGPTGEAVLCDGLADDAVCAALLGTVGDGREFPTREGVIRGTATAAFAGLRGDPTRPLAVERGPATSSNSLVFYGQKLLLKAFRRLQPGVNPDYEVGRFLTERAGFDRTPRVAGLLEYVRPGHEPAALGLLQEVVPSQGDGWDHALAELKDYCERPGEEPVGDYLQAAATLGRRTAQMHLALASEPHDPAFAPEPLTVGDANALRDDVLRQGRRALALLGQALDRLPADVAPTAQRLLDEGPETLDRLATATVVVPAAAKTRVHGDYHLGQLLWTGGDYVILDFEGEPTRPLAERRAKFSPVRDVAGMLRSYHYAAYAGLFDRTRDRPDEFARLEPRARAWQRQVSAAFLGEYRAAAGSAGFLPQDSREFAALLYLFVLGKAFFELAYELNNRPDWVRIPLQGILSLWSRDR
ncbi:MAG TPA: putative maltokinase [Fimbriiglobus sp.]|jgi:maltose alpha-D-glucosyltransferase/alpha-amylase|nr:putative maltokinase [Fimbriiglobus sp.]